MNKKHTPEMFVTLPTFDDDGQQVSSGILQNGKEMPDPVPTAPPVGYQAPPDLMQMIRTMIHGEKLREELLKQELETFEEADDFEIEDDPIDRLTDYERVFEPPPSPPKPVETAPPAPVAPKTEVLDTSVLGDTSKPPQTTLDANQKPAGKAS